MDAVDFEAFSEQLAEIDPAALQDLLQSLLENVPAVQKIVQNVLDEPISQETEKRLHKPLLPKPSNQELHPGKEGREKGKNF